MVDKSCIHCGQPAESDSDVVTRAGAVHEGCWATYSGDNDSQVIASRPMQFLGVLLRFLGMIVIGMSAFYLFFSDRDAETIIMSLIAGSFGAAMHFAGRKIAPDAHWASAAGGVVVGVGSIAMMVAVACAMLFVLGRDCRILKHVDGLMTGNACRTLNPTTLLPTANGRNQPFE